MAQADDIVFLFDVDNTLLDNDCVQAHLSKHLGEIYVPPLATDISRF
jgi:hypothetical protein